MHDDIKIKDLLATIETQRIFIIEWKNLCYERKKITDALFEIINKKNEAMSQMPDQLDS